MGLFNLIGRISKRLRVPNPLAGDQATHAPQEFRADDAAIKLATDLVASAVADLTEAAKEMHKKGGIIAGTVSLGTTAYNEVAGKEEGPTLKDAGKTVTHDGRYPARDLVASAMEKYNEALMYVTDLPHIEGIVIKAPNKAVKAAAGGAQIAMLASGVVVGPIGLIVKKARQKKARKGVDQMLEDMQEVLDDLRQARTPLMGGQGASQP